MKCTLLSRVDASPCYVTYGARNFHRRAKQIGFKALKLPTLNSCHEKHDARIEEKTWSCHDESKNAVYIKPNKHVVTVTRIYIWPGKHIPPWVGKNMC